MMRLGSRWIDGWRCYRGRGEGLVCIEVMRLLALGGSGGMLGFPMVREMCNGRWKLWDLD